jgi:hypothetical protein
VGAFGLSGETSEVVEFCAALPGPTRVTFEAGADRLRAGAGAARRGDRLRWPNDADVAREALYAHARGQAAATA